MLFTEPRGWNANDPLEDFVEVVGIPETGIQGDFLHRGVGFNHSPLGSIEAQSRDFVRDALPQG